MVLVSLFSPTLETVAIATGVVSWPGVARLARAEFMRIRELDFIKASRSIGARDRRIIWNTHPAKCTAALDRERCIDGWGGHFV